MTTEDFKKCYPQYSHLEGNELWDKMTEVKLYEQYVKEQSRKTFFQKYKLRYLFYRHRPNLVIGSIKTDKYKASDRCSKCKKGVNHRLVIWYSSNESASLNPCPHCGEEYIKEKNTNISHRLYKLSNRIKELFFVVMDKLHIIKNSVGGRFDMFDGEKGIVTGYSYDKDWTNVKPILRKRKWFEWVFVPR